MADAPPRDEQLLRLSVWGAVAFAVLALVWGVFVRSQLILFDGMYSTISVVLSGLSLLAYRAIRRGPDERYPFGREVLASVVVLVKGVAIGVLCLYALAVAVLDLVGGGREVAAGWAAGYALAATLGCGVVVLLLRRRGSTSGLVRAEAAQWMLDTILSAAILVGFLVAIVLERTGNADVAAFVDPGMVALVSLWFLRLPGQLIREGWYGLVAARPAAPVDREVRSRVDRLVRDHGYADHVTRVATFGERLDVEVELLVTDADAGADVATLDRFRDELDEAMAGVGVPVWATATVTRRPERLRPTA
jgi:predicted Co/Zn/Cd cation transporter (cation efflux family)